MAEHTHAEDEGAEDTKSARAAVLLLDDDKFLLDMYTMKFTHEGYAVHACLSVDEALALLKGGFSPDVILFDITMPVRDGFDFLQAVQNEKLGGRALKIPLTNQSSDAEKARAKDLGADDYFVKASMIPSEVVNKVGELLGKKRARS